MSGKPAPSAGIPVHTTGARPVAVARIGVGTAALAKLAVLGPTLLALGDPAILRVPMAPGLPTLPAGALPAVVAVWITAATAFALGWRTRTSGAALTGAMLVTLLGDQQLYSNHLYLTVILTVLLTVADAGAALSLDARREGTRERVLAWPTLLLRLQVTIVYGFAALAKLNLVYLPGVVLGARLGRGSLLPFPDALRRWEVMSALAILSVVVEAALALALWSRRWRPAGFVVGLVFHVSLVLLVAPAGELAIFALLMFSLYALHLDAPLRARTVVWDDRCSFCGAWVRWLRRMDLLGVHRFVGSSTAETLPGGISRAEADEAIQLVGPRGRLRGFDAVRAVLEKTPAGFLWAPLLRLPGVRSLGRRAYRRVAARRRCGLDTS